MITQIQIQGLKTTIIDVAHDSVGQSFGLKRSWAHPVSTPSIHVQRQVSRLAAYKLG